MTSAIATMEQRISGQIGQPAACMIENNPDLSAASGFWDARLWRDGVGEQAPHRCAGVDTTLPLAQSTACVDNFVGNSAWPACEPRKRWARHRLLKN
jgi:hypothetical protein